MSSRSIRICSMQSNMTMLWSVCLCSVFKMSALNSNNTFDGLDEPVRTRNNNSMRRWCVALHEASGGHTRYWLLFGPQGVGVDPRVCLRHTCAIIMLSNQHLDMPHLWGGWIISAKEKCSLTQIKTDLWTMFERNRPFVYIEKVLDLWVQLMKNVCKNKSVAFITLFSICAAFLT